MKDKPRILWIDDVYGKTQNGHNRHRDHLCSRLELNDITGDCLPQKAPEPRSNLLVIDDRKMTNTTHEGNREDEILADVIFCRGQVEVSGEVRNDLNRTLEVVRNGWKQPPRWSLLLLDMHFATGVIGEEGEPHRQNTDLDPEKYFGLTVLNSLWRDDELQDIPVVITSGRERDVIERLFPTQGVWAFVDKSDLNKAKLEELLNHYGLLADEKIIGDSLLLLQCLREARRRAYIPNENIFILGESGTGKELLAKYIHQQSGRGGEYVCFSQVLEDTLEDELSKTAKLADGGTLFIDNFGDISATFHAKLPQILRNICNRDLQVIMAIEREKVLYEDNFRKSLPDGVQIHNVIWTPTLSERVEDIPLLVDHFVKKYEKESKAQQRQVSDEALEVLRTYPWPDNVGELESVIKNAVYNNKLVGSLEANHLYLESLSHQTHIPPMPSNQPNSFDLFNIILQDDTWEQLRESIGEMVIWLQDMAIWVLTEKALRSAIDDILSKRIESGWIENVRKNNDELKNIFKGCERDRQKYLGNFHRKNSDSPDLINFTSPSDPFNIILDQDLWNHFREFFGRDDPNSDEDRQEEWRARKNSIVERVRHLMNHSNPDLIQPHHRLTFRGYCGAILYECQDIENVLSKQDQQPESELPLPNAMDRDQEGAEQGKGEQEELCKGIVCSIMSDDDVANVQIEGNPTILSSRESNIFQVPRCDFQNEDAFQLRKKIKFKVEKIGNDFRLYDVFLAEPE